MQFNQVHSGGRGIAHSHTNFFTSILCGPAFTWPLVDAEELKPLPDAPTPPGFCAKVKMESRGTFLLDLEKWYGLSPAIDREVLLEVSI